MSIIYLPTHDIQLMRPPRYTYCPVGAFSSYAGSEGAYYDYQGSGLSDYLDANYLSFPS